MMAASHTSNTINSLGYMMFLVISLILLVVVHAQDEETPSAVHEVVCGTKFIDPSSSALRADIVLQGNVEDLRQASPLAPLLYKAKVAVHKVYKGQELLRTAGTEDNRSAAARRSGVASHVEVERFGPNENRENCVARVLTGQTYLFFLRVKDVRVADQGASTSSSSARSSRDDGERSSSDDLLVLVNTALPHEMDLKVLKQVKKVLCPGCTSIPVIKRLRCKHCAAKPIMKRKMSANDTKTIKAGKRLSLRCVARGSPRPAYSWLKDGAVLFSPEEESSSSSGSASASGGRRSASVFRSGALTVRSSRQHSLLVIKKVTPEDQGTYRCLAVNAVGEAEQTVQVVVAGGRLRPSPSQPDLDRSRPSQPDLDRSQPSHPDLDRSRPSEPDLDRSRPSQPDLEEESPGRCADNPCYNGGTCFPDDSQPRRVRCQCLSDYHGRKCQFRRHRTVDETDADEDDGSDDDENPSLPSNAQPDVNQNNNNNDISNSRDQTSASQTTTTNSNNERLDNAQSGSAQGSSDSTTTRNTYKTKKQRRKYDSSAKSSKSGAPRLKVSQCPETDTPYCFNGGACKVVVKLQRKFCECSKGYGGRRCEVVLITS